MKKTEKKSPRRKINLPRLTRISFLPSVFTMFNLFLGYIALNFVTKGEFINACYYLIFATVVDSLDGTIARLTKTESNFGVQLDSLSDAVSFGLVPSVFMYLWAFKTLMPVSGIIISFIYLSAGIIRLAHHGKLNSSSGAAPVIWIKHHVSICGGDLTGAAGHNAAREVLR